MEGRTVASFGEGLPFRLELRGKEDSRGGGACWISCRNTKERLCDHEFELDQITGWLEFKEPQHHPCPKCDIRSRGTKPTTIGDPLEGVDTDNQVLDMVDELMTNYGPYFLVIDWEGEHPEDTNYQIYSFSDLDRYEGFAAAVDGYPSPSPELSVRSASFAKGHARGTKEYDYWGSLRKFGNVVFRSV